MGNGMKMWKGNRNTTTLLFSGPEVLHQGRRDHGKTRVMEHFNRILFYKSGPANKEHTVLINKSINVKNNIKLI